MGKYKILDTRHNKHEDKEDGEILDPAPLDDLPEARSVEQSLGRIMQSCFDGEELRTLPNYPVAVAILQLDAHISKMKNFMDSIAKIF